MVRAMLIDAPSSQLNTRLSRSKDPSFVLAQIRSLSTPFVQRRRSIPIAKQMSERRHGTRSSRLLREGQTVSTPRSTDTFMHLIAALQSMHSRTSP